LEEEFVCPWCGRAHTLVWKPNPEYPGLLFTRVECECGYWGVGCVMDEDC